jgi:hypothetical protein
MPMTSECFQVLSSGRPTTYLERTYVDGLHESIDESVQDFEGGRAAWPGLASPGIVKGLVHGRAEARNHTNTGSGGKFRLRQDKPGKGESYVR